MKQVLSTQGYLKATSIMALESVLAVIDNNPVVRDPENYYFTIFGIPTTDGVWGWRLEGHHLSLNFAAASGELAVTPAFWGSNPAEVRIPPSTGLRVLGNEEDLGRAILAALTDAQRDQAVIADTAAGGIVTGADREARIEGFEGVPVADLSPDQRQHVMALLSEVGHNLQQEFARAQIERMLATGLEGFHFAWAGPATPGEGHYYRLHSPTTLIEYDNTQSDANHVHFVWRDLENDFGVDLLRQHYDGSAPDHGHDH
jgi:hypothetical protein